MILHDQGMHFPASERDLSTPERASDLDNMALRFYALHG